MRAAPPAAASPSSPGSQEQCPCNGGAVTRPSVGSENARPGCAEEFGPCGVNRAMVPVTGRRLLGLRVPRTWLLSLVWGEATCARRRVGTWQRSPGCECWGCLLGCSCPGRVPVLPSPPFAACGLESGSQTCWSWAVAWGPPAAGHLGSKGGVLRSPPALAWRRWCGAGRLCPGIWLWERLAQTIFPGDS